MGLLNGKVAIITGAARGIGLGIVEKFVAEGARVSLNGRNVEMLENLAKNINEKGGDAFIVPGDVGDPNVPEQVVNKTIEHFGKLDIVVSNAGIIDRAPTLEMTLENWHRIIDVNLTGSMLLATSALRYFKEQKSGKIIFISSIGAKTINKNASPAYGCSKAAMTYLMRHLAWEFGPYGVTVNSVLPGYIQSDMSSGQTPERKKQLLGEICLGKVGDPKDIGNGVLFFASELGDYCTGECLDVNGGLQMD